MFSIEATIKHFIVLGLIRPGFKPTIYRSHFENAYHYITDAVGLEQGEIDCTVYD
jgi:hypothetical protein